MKRIIIVCLCLSLLSLLIIPAFASSLSDQTSYPCEFVFDDEEPAFELSGYTASLDFTCDGIHYTSIDFDNVEVVLKYISSSGQTTVCDGGWLDSKYKTIIINSAPSSTVINWLNLNGTVFEPVPSPLDELGVGDGVSTSIGWFGGVLANIVSSPYVLPLVGLAVALFCVLPFGITTIKNLMKGY